jgi:hypothetical protein
VRLGPACALLLVTGCQQLFGVQGGHAGNASDANRDAIDALVDAPTGCTPVGKNGTGAEMLASTGFFSTCIEDGLSSVMLTAGFSTDDAAAMCDDRLGADVCTIVASQITVSNVVVTGSKPLVLAASQQISIQGILDVSSAGGGQASGPGANWSGCPNTLDANSGGNGGAGGTINIQVLNDLYQAGNGGFSSGANPDASYPQTPFAAFHGGCAGGLGDVTNGGPQPRADSGGALYLMAPDVNVSGAILADGAPGAGGSFGDGGGYGGGSGGIVAFDAVTIETLTATIHAYGGGGGAGGETSAPGPGGTGHLGGQSNVVGGASGGNGYNNATRAFSGGNGNSSQAATGGGGGGGGAGAVLIFSSDLVASNPIDPTPTR